MAPAQRTGHPQEVDLRKMKGLNNNLMRNKAWTKSLMIGREHRESVVRFSQIECQRQATSTH